MKVSFLLDIAPPLYLNLLIYPTNSSWTDYLYHHQNCSKKNVKNRIFDPAWTNRIFDPAWTNQN